MEVSSPFDIVIDDPLGLSFVSSNLNVAFEYYHRTLLHRYALGLLGTKTMITSY